LQAKTGKMTGEPVVKQGDEDQHDYDQQRYGQQGESAAPNQLTADRRLS
jgi:hypothetical protein